MREREKKKRQSFVAIPRTRPVLNIDTKWYIILHSYAVLPLTSQKGKEESWLGSYGRHPLLFIIPISRKW
jgi:hypothetical protein